MVQDCILYIPQLQTSFGQWIEVGIPVSSFEEAVAQESHFPLNNRLVAFRVIQTSCQKQQIQRTCCGR